MKPSSAALLSSIAAAALALGASVLEAVALAASHGAPARAALEPAPSVAGADAAAGRTLFMQNCSHCHGADARGDEGPDLHGLRMSDRYIARVVRRGIEGEMPAFIKKLGPPEIASLLLYLRSLE